MEVGGDREEVAGACKGCLEGRVRGEQQRVYLEGIDWAKS